MSRTPFHDPTLIAGVDPDDGTPLVLGMIHGALMTAEGPMGQYLRKFVVLPIDEYEPPNYPDHIDVEMATGVYRVTVQKVVAT